MRLPEFTTSGEFVRLIKEEQVKDTPLRRFKIIKHEVNAYPGKGPNLYHVSCGS